MFNTPMVDSSTGIISVAFSSVGALTGLIIASVKSVKPQHDFFIEQMRAAGNVNKWRLVIHVSNKIQMKRTQHVLGHYSDNISTAT